MKALSRRHPIVAALALACTLAAPALATAPALAAAPAATSKPDLWLGAAWYPEQWPESRWDADLSLMQQAGVRFVRIGEFAWSRMEPSEGTYELDWIDHAIRAAERHGIYVVLGTPGAAPPAWLTQKYPSTLRTMEDGRKDEHGNREQFDWTDPKYLQLTRSIAEQMGKRFGHDPDVVGWQIDNEYAAESYGPDDRTRFQAWLKAHYVTLDNLNARWTSSYWSETYTSWDQIPIETKYGNPGLLLSWKHFVSDSYRAYQKNQLDVLHPNIESRQFITTNLMGWFDGYDQYTVTQDLSLASWDDYVGTGQLDPVRNGAAHDLTRGYLRKNFWVMETQPGFVNWSKNNNALNKGEVRAMAWHDIGHGADAVEYWQWRSALNGQEQYHGVLVGADGTPVPLYPEVAELGAEFKKAGPVLAGTSPRTDVAILHSFDSRWAIDWQRHNQAFSPVDSLLSYYGPLRAAVHTVDIVAPTVDLSQYKLVVAPALNVLPKETADHLLAWVKAGGHLVLGQRSAMKDEDNALWPANAPGMSTAGVTEQQPGPLAEPLGARVAQFYALDQPVPVSGDWGSGTTHIWADQLGPLPSPGGVAKESQQPASAALPTPTFPNGTRVLMTYGASNGWLDNQPAAVTRAVGKGSITYIGAALDPATMKNAVAWMVKSADLHPLQIAVPDDVELSIRSSADGKREVFILVSLAREPRTVALPTTMTDVLHGGSTQSVSLPAYGVAVLANR